jgi:hypothetical protein
MQSNLIVTLAALALAAPAVVLATPASSGGGGGGGGSSGGASYGGGSSGGSSSSGASSNGSSTGGHGSGGGSGSAHGGTGAGSGFASRAGGGVARYGIQVGPHNGGQGGPAIELLTRGAAHAVRIENAAQAISVAERTRPPHPGVPKVHPVAHTQSCTGSACQSNFQMPDLYCMDPPVEDLLSTPLDCPRAIKTRDLTGPTR